MNRKNFPYVLFTAVAFAAMEPASKLLSGQVDPLALTFLRFFIGSLALLPLALRTMKKQRLSLNRRDLLGLAARGILCVCVSMGLLQAAVFNAQSAAVIAVVFSTNSVMTALFAAWLLQEKLTRRRIAALALCMAGVAVGGAGAAAENVRAVALALLAAVAMSLFTVLGKRELDRIPTRVQIGLSFSIGTALLGAALAVAGVPLTVRALDARSLCILLFLGVVVTGLGYLSYFKAMEKAGAFMASLVFFIKPVLAPLMSLLILGEARGGAALYASIALVMAGSTLMLSERKEKQGEEVSGDLSGADDAL